MDKVNNPTNRPRWIRAKYASHCSCGRKITIANGLLIILPTLPGKRVECESCGRKYKRRFYRMP